MLQTLGGGAAGPIGAAQPPFCGPLSDRGHRWSRISRVLGEAPSFFDSILTSRCTMKNRLGANKIVRGIYHIEQPTGASVQHSPDKRLHSLECSIPRRSQQNTTIPQKQGEEEKVQLLALQVFVFLRYFNPLLPHRHFLLGRPDSHDARSRHC